MKHRLAAIVLILLFSCSKKQDVPDLNFTPTDTIPNSTGNSSIIGDTLTTGWTKVNQRFSDIYFSDNLTG